MESSTYLELLVKAISNKKRQDILKYIQQEEFLIKKSILGHFNLQQADLDFHLVSLEEAGLIGLTKIKIKDQNYVFVYPKASWEIKIFPLDTAHLTQILPSEISYEDYREATESFWKTLDFIKNPKIIKKVLESLATKLDDLTKIACYSCRKNIGILKCSICNNVACSECAQIIKKADNSQAILCDNCIN
ncbi:MAG: hypothetical protein ACXADY_17665 [Candidatus Hodarchaeales archaeon]|jgi:DNA-binding transcriptional ArsR family regulator